MTETNVKLTAVDILSQAREHLTPPDQWVKGTWISNQNAPVQKQACSMGAMLLAEGITSDRDASFAVATDQLMARDPEFRIAVAALAAAAYDTGGGVYQDWDYEYDAPTDVQDPWEYYTEGHYTDFVVEFNDNEYTTHDDVLAVFDAAIKELSK